MPPDEVIAVSRISPQWAPYIVLAAPLLGALAFAVQWLPTLPMVRHLALRLVGWDPGAVPEDEASRRTMQLIDQLQEELTRCRTLLDRYGVDIDQLRQARLSMLSHMVELRDAAIAARTMVHSLERQAGLPETPFEALPGVAPASGVGGETIMAG